MPVGLPPRKREGADILPLHTLAKRQVREVPDAVAERIEELYLRSRHKRRGPVTIRDTWWRASLLLWEREAATLL